MVRIILKILLIIACGGFVIHAAVDEHTVSIVAEKETTLNEQSFSTDSKGPSSSESVTATNGANQTSADFTSNSTTQPHSSSSTVYSTKEDTNTSVTKNAETTESISADISNKTTASYDSHVDYGGYNATLEFVGKIATVAADLQKAGLRKHEDKYKLITTGTDNSFTLAETTFGEKKDVLTTSSISNPSESTTLDSVSITTLYSDDNTNMIDVVPSKHPVDSPQRVSASPKSATKKRSLNSTDYLSFNDGSAPTLSHADISTVFHNTDLDLQTSTTSKLDSFHTTVKTNPTLEELPTPLPLEIETEKKSVSKLISNIDQLFSTELASSINESEEKETENPSAAEINSNGNMESLTNGNRIESSTEIEDREPLSPEREYEAKTLNATGYTIVDGTKNSVTENSNASPIGILSHENDDIIYAGFADDDSLGVTFDPDGMKNEFPQDPDSIIFSVPPKDSTHEFEKQVYGANIDTSTILNKGDMNQTLESVTSSNQGKEFTKPWIPEQLPHDAPEAELEAINGENASVIFNPNLVSKSNHSESLVLPEIVYSIPTSMSDDAGGMLQDAPHNDFSPNPLDGFVTAMTKTTPKEDYSQVNEKDSNNSGITGKSMDAVTDVSKVESQSSDVSHHSEQSVIRPVKIKLTSPAAEPVPTSAPPGVSLTQAYELSTGSARPSLATSVNNGAMKVANLHSDTSTPDNLPNPVSSTTEKSTETLDLDFSTINTQPELVSPSVNDQALINDNGTESIASKPNTKIAGVAVKTSVSVSLPLSKSANESMSVQKSEYSVNTSTSSNGTNLPPTSLLNDSSALLQISTTETPSTTASGPKIRKPIIKVPGGTEDRTRKPFTPSYRRPPTTSGPPVSIFSKSRTRLNSITSSTTHRSISQFSTIRIHYASRMPGIKPDEELFVSVEPITTTVPPTTTTEEPISEVPFTDQTFTPSLSSEDDVTLIKVGGGIMLERGLSWTEQLGNRHSPEYREKATQIHLHLDRLFRSSPIADRFWRIEIDGFNGTKNSRSVEVDFILYLIKSADKIALEHLTTVFHEKLSPNNTFARYRVDPSRTAFEILQEEPLNKPTLSPDEEQPEPPVPQWAIAVIVICAASLIFVVLFAAVTMYGRHHMRRRYGNKLSEDYLERSSGEWESKMTAAYENMAADTVYDADDLPGDSYKKAYIVD